MKHQETHNVSNVEVTCEICNENFDSLNHLRQHIMDSHGDPNVMCELCGKECRPDKLKQHIE